MGPGRATGRVPAWQPSTGHHASKLVLTCHDRLPFVQPRLRAGMAIHGEVVLRQRVCRGSGCHAVFWICAHCDRGQRYCSLACRAEARLQQRRCANCRHQRSPEGRMDHRDRQREYRRRRAQARVTDQGSLSIISPALCGCGTPGNNADSSELARPSSRCGSCAASSAGGAAVSLTHSHELHDPDDEIDDPSRNSRRDSPLFLRRALEDRHHRPRTGHSPGCRSQSH